MLPSRLSLERDLNDSNDTGQTCTRNHITQNKINPEKKCSMWNNFSGFKIYLPKWIKSIETSDGEIPEIRDA